MSNTAQPPVMINEVKMVPVAKLQPHPKNRNRHPKPQIERLAKIIEYQGWRYPIKVSTRSGYITTGHGRLMAAQLRGWELVPVSYQDYDSDEQEYADVQADNAIALWSELDLSGINVDISDLGPDFDLDLLGIENFSLDVPVMEFGKSITEKRDGLDERNFRQIVFIMNIDKFEWAVEKMTKLREQWGVESNTDVLVRLLEEVLPE